MRYPISPQPEQAQAQTTIPPPLNPFFFTNTIRIKPLPASVSHRNSHTEITTP